MRLKYIHIELAPNGTHHEDDITQPIERQQTKSCNEVHRKIYMHGFYYLIFIIINYGIIISLLIFITYILSHISLLAFLLSLAILSS